MKLFKLIAVAPLVLLSADVFAQSRDHRDGDRGRYDSHRSDDRGRYNGDHRYGSAGYAYSYTASRPYSYYPRGRSYGYVSVATPYRDYYDDYDYAPDYAYGAYDYPSYYRSYGYYPSYRPRLSVGVRLGRGFVRAAPYRGRRR